MTGATSDYPVKESRLFIGGSWASSPESDTLHCPADGQAVVTVHRATEADVQQAVTMAVDAQRAWARTPAYERSAVLVALTDQMRHRAPDLAAQMTVETGRPIRESRTEVARSISTMEISAEEAKRVHGEVIAMDAVAPGAGKTGFTIRTPVGVVAAITPFNAPLNSICHKLGPALAAGNAMVLKPHPYGSGMATLLAEMCEAIGLPAGLFSVVHGGPAIGRALVTAGEVAFINFTGSGRVAEQILADAGIRRTLLELGGNAPTIVHHDADVKRALPQIVEASFGLAGQSCISTQRLFVHRDRYDEVERGLVAAAASRRPGDIWDESTEVGPMISVEAAQRVEAWVNEAVSSGARLLCGGTRDGAYVLPTVLADVPDTARVLCDEVFGPVVSLVAYDDIDDVFVAANATPWGLKAGIFTNSLDVALRAAQELEFGTVNINAASRARVDQEPSGGVKESGWGKEGPRYAIAEMTNERMITFRPTP
jgi:acyl-CoA reductase-like NAD-dependent aldehyde dehydrogenase